MLSDETGFFASAQAHALSLLETCNDDLEEARAAAMLSIEFSRDVNQQIYWSDVLQALITQEAMA